MHRKETEVTRINCIAPNELTDAHLGAEYRELPRVFALVFAAHQRGERPDDARNPAQYTLGAGHVRFFYNKLAWCAARYYALVQECRARGRKVSFGELGPTAQLVPEEWWGDWKPTPAAQELNRSRIQQRLREAA
jgi:deoxyribonuclease (pyrimidine dimer)